MSGLKSLLRVAPIGRADADRIVKRVHYSGSVVRNAQLHLGVFWDGRLEGAMQFGPALDKRRSLGLVPGTPWNGMIELNRMAFGERLPRNSESRALSWALRFLRSEYPHLQWVQTFADATQCGDGTIYRAVGFLLTAVKPNKTIWSLDGRTFTDISIHTRGLGGDAKHAHIVNRVSATTKPDATTGGASSMAAWRAAGAAPLPGFQIRYVYFLDPSARERLAVPVLPYGVLDEKGARMARGVAKRG